MTCQKAGELLSAYIEGELAARPSAALETHLTGCDGCREELETLRSVVAMLEAPKAFARPEGLLEEFKEKYLPAAEAEPAPRWGFRLPALPQFEWPSMGRVLLPMGGMAAAAAALMVALHSQPMPNTAGPAAPSGPNRIASAVEPAVDGTARIDIAAPESAVNETGPKIQPSLKQKSSAATREKAPAAPAAASKKILPRPAEKVMPAPPRASRRPRVFLADAATPRLELRRGRSRPIPLKAGEQYAAAQPAAPAMDEKEMAAAGSAHQEATPTLEDQWKSVAAVTLRRNAAVIESSDAGYAEVSCRNVKTGEVTGEVKWGAFGAPVAATTPAEPAVSAPAEIGEPVETDAE